MHIVIDALRDSILITGLVVIMMMLLESINIESSGKLFPLIRKTRVGQVIFAALLGSVPGCLGGFATVSLYTHRLFSFGALIAMMIASSGDEAFVMLAMVPKEAMWIFVSLFFIAVAVGLSVDAIHRKRCPEASHENCDKGLAKDDVFEVHEHDEKDHHEGRHFDLKRLSILLGLVVFLGALVAGFLDHEHGEEVHEHAEAGLNLLSEEWMYYLFAMLSLIVVVVLVKASDHFIHEHLWDHIVKKHLHVIFGWTFGTLLVVGLLLHHFDVSQWVSSNEILMIVLAAAVGCIPESGPHLLFVTLFASGAAPLSVLMASCISQDGHASLPLLAESKVSFLKAKIINFTVAVAVGIVIMLIF